MRFLFFLKERADGLFCALRWKQGPLRSVPLPSCYLHHGDTGGRTLHHRTVCDAHHHLDFINPIQVSDPRRFVLVFKHVGFSSADAGT